METKKTKVLFLVISVVAVCCLSDLLSLSGIQYSNSILPWLLLPVIYKVQTKSLPQTVTRRDIKYSWIFGLLLAGFTSFGYHLEHDELPLSSPWFYVAIIVYSWVFSCVIRLLWQGINRGEEKLEAAEATSTSRFINSFLDKRWLVWGTLLLCWIPAFLSIFPGGLGYDVEGELRQYDTGYVGNYPLLHSAIFTTLLPLSLKITGSYALGLGIYVALQMVLAAAIFTQILRKFRGLGFSPYVVGGMWIYFAFMPFVAMTVVHSVRDIIFAILVTYSVFLLYVMNVEKKQFFSSWVRPVWLGVILTLTLMARNNNAGITMFAVLLLIMVIVWWKNRRQYRKGVTILAVSTLGSFLIIGGLLSVICSPKVSGSNPNTSMSFFSQSIARAYMYEGDTFTDEEKAQMARYFDLERLQYYSNWADPTKNNMDLAYGDSKLRWVKNFSAFWLKTGLKHKQRFIEGVTATNRCMWFPADVMNGYNNHPDLYVGCEKCAFAFQSGEYMIETGTPHWLPAVEDFYRNIGLNLSYEKIPLLSMLFSIGFQFWILLNCCFMSWNYRLKKLYLPLGLALAYMIVTSFVPLILLRYFIAIFYMMPMILAFTLQPKVSNCSHAD